MNTQSDPSTAEGLLHQAASVLLPGAPEHIEVPDGATAQELLNLAQVHGVLGPLLLALPESATELRSEAADRHNPMLAWCMDLELRLLEINEWFDRAGGVEFRVLKGAAVAHLDEADPSLRTFADLDLLVHSRDMDRAIAVLEANDVRRRIPQRRPGFDRRFVKGVGMRCEDGIEIDIHRTLCVGALGFRIRLDDLFADPEYFEVGGERFPTMRLEHRALHAAYHAVMGTTVPPLRTLRDLAGYLTDPRLTPDVLVPVARRWGGLTVLGEAVRATLATLTVDAPEWSEWIHRFLPDESETRLIEQSSTNSPWPVEYSVLRELRWRDRALYIWAVGFPSNEVLKDRGQGQFERLRSGTRRLLSRR